MNIDKIIYEVVNESKKKKKDVKEWKEMNT